MTDAERLGIKVVSDCRLTSGQWFSMPGGYRPYNETPVNGCSCDACESGRRGKWLEGKLAALRGNENTP